MTAHSILTGKDQGVSSILGFIVGFALLAGAMAAVAYFMLTLPDAGTSEEAKDLDSQARRASDALATSPGYPQDWHVGCDEDTWETPSQVGLLRKGTNVAHLEKIRCLQTGDVNATTLLEANNLRNEDVRMYAEGNVVPIAAMEAPGTTTHALAEGSIDGDMNEISTTPETRRGLQHFQEVNQGFTWQLHAWNWSLGQEPSQGLGNTFVDSPWHTETQMLPVMAGLASTYSVADPVEHGTLEDASQAAQNKFEHNQHDRVTRWHVISEHEPYGFPGSIPEDAYDKHVFTTNYRHGGADHSSGVGQWRTIDGMRTYAMLSPVDISGAAEARLTFDHVLRVENTDTKITCDETYNDDGHPNDTDCVEVRPAIRFWNTTSEEWTRLRVDPEDCNPAASETWDDNGTAEAEASFETDRTVDLCEALNHATDGDLWLMFEWFTMCKDTDGAPVACSTLLGGDTNAVRGWFLTDVEVTVDGETRYHTDFELGDSLETLFVSHGVDHSYHEAAGESQDLLLGPVRQYVINGGNVIAYEPGGQGNFLGHVGLEAVERNETRHVDTLDPDHMMMRLPNELPADHEAYDPGAATDALAWNNKSPSLPYDPTELENADPPIERVKLDIVQQTNEDNLETTDNAVATLLTGTPYPGGGKVTGLGYNVSDFNDTDLRDKLLENTYTSTLFLDPSFTTIGASVPESGTVPVSTAQRVVLAEVTDTGQHQVPLEISLYVWPEGLG